MCEQTRWAQIIGELESGELPLGELLSLKWLPAWLLHRFACLCAEQVLLFELESGRDVDARLLDGLAAKRRWIEGRLEEFEWVRALDLVEQAADPIRWSGQGFLQGMMRGFGRVFLGSTKRLANSEDMAEWATELPLHLLVAQLVLEAMNVDPEIASQSVSERCCQYRSAVAAVGSSQGILGSVDQFVTRAGSASLMDMLQGMQRGLQGVEAIWTVPQELEVLEQKLRLLGMIEELHETREQLLQLFLERRERLQARVERAGQEFEEVLFSSS